MQKILVIGCGGSGKSTLSTALGKKTSLPVIHLDKIYWTGDWQNIPEAEFDEKLDAELKKDSWIIDGNYNRTLSKRISYCDTVIYLDYPTVMCLFGAIKRVLANYGTTRADMGGNCRERFDLEFFGWILSFRRRYRKKYIALLEEARAEGKSVYIFKSRRMSNRFLSEI